MNTTMKTMFLTAITSAVLAITACSPTNDIETMEPDTPTVEETTAAPSPTTTEDVEELLSEIFETEEAEEAETEAAEETRELSSDKASLLNALTVSEQKDDGKYERPDTWKSASRYSVDAPQGNCTVRQAVLYRDGEGVKINDNCQPTYGSWTDPYTGVKYGVGGAPGEPTEIGNLHIDHRVAAKHAYVSGAHAFTEDTFLTFAHDVNNLVVSEGSGNSAKSDHGPETWKPELESAHCEYAESWIDTKTDWELTVTQEEKSALEDMLATC